MRTFTLLAILFVSVGLFVLSCRSDAGGSIAAAERAEDSDTQAHRDEVMTSAYCGRCHPAIFAEKPNRG